MSDQKIFAKLFNSCEKLVKKNKDLMERTGRSVVASAIMAKSGKVYYGTNVGWWHSTCAEVVALSNAWRAGEREMKYVVAVKYDRLDGSVHGLSPCGICREMFNNLQPEIKIVLKDSDGNFVAKQLNEMLPELEDLEH